MRREVPVLMRKEFAQLVRNKSAVATALVVPAVLLVLVPIAQASGVSSALPRSAGTSAFHGAVRFADVYAEAMADPRAMLRLTLPLLATLSGLIVPLVMAIYTVISERESRTLELLAALPVRIEHVIVAKLSVIVLVAGSATGAMLACDVVLLSSRHVAGGAFFASLFAVLFSSLLFSTSMALLLCLWSRDFRTANNIGGALFGPVIAIAAFVFLSLPGPLTRLWGLVALFLSGAVLLAIVSLRLLSFERFFE